MKWVKASERVPEWSDSVHIHYTNGKTDYNETARFIGGKWYKLTGERILWRPNLEWLDENTPSPNPSGLLDALQSIDAYSDVADPPLTPKQFGDIARKALASYQSPALSIEEGNDKSDLGVYENYVKASTAPAIEGKQEQELDDMGNDPM